MNEKKRIKMLIGIVVIITLSVSGYVYAQSYIASGAQNVTSTINSSRFIMFGGAYTLQGSESATSAVFKLDTYTGNTWMLKVYDDGNGGQIEKWGIVDIKTIGSKQSGNSTVPPLKELYNNK